MVPISIFWESVSQMFMELLLALTAIDLTFVEVHLSNIFARGGWHADSIFSANAVGLLCGFQDRVYPLGVQAFYDFLINNICK